MGMTILVEDRPKYIKPRTREWTGADAGGAFLLLFLAVAAAVIWRALLRDRDANRAHRARQRAEFGSALRAFGSEPMPRDPDESERPARKAAPAPKPPSLKERVAALPEQMSPEEFNALPADLKAHLLGTMRGARK